MLVICPLDKSISLPTKHISFLIQSPALKRSPPPIPLCVILSTWDSVVNICWMNSVILCRLWGAMDEYLG